MSKEVAPDYNAFVPEEAEMYLAAMERDARAGRYNGRGEMRAHAALIAANAATYNSAGACAFARASRPVCNKPSSLKILREVRVRAALIAADAATDNSAGACASACEPPGSSCFKAMIRVRG